MPTDAYENIDICECCGGYWCISCDEHYADCSCPPIDQWDKVPQEVAVGPIALMDDDAE